MPPALGDKVLTEHGITHRLGEGPRFSFPPPPRACSDFLVKEIHGLSLAPREQASASSYPLYRLVKEGVDTLVALSRLTRATGLRGWSFAGLKDARALTVQWVTGPGGLGNRVPGRVCFEGGLALLEGWVVRRVGRGSHVGNLFLLNTRAPASEGRLARVFPNYYGPQRFGDSPPYTHELGAALLRDGAGGLYTILRDRGRTRGWWERKFIEEYESRPQACEGDPRRCLGRMAMVLAEAVQAYVFNRCLSEILPSLRRELLGKPGVFMGLLWGWGRPRVGGGGRVVSRHVECVGRVVREMGLDGGGVAWGLLPRGGLRPLSLAVESLRVCVGKGGLRLLFRLPPGAYASVYAWENAEGVVGWFMAPCRASGFWRRAGCG